MKCNNCKTKLNHMQLKQVYENDIYEIECFNPNCRELNLMSKEAYFSLKREVIGIANMIRPKAKVKLPSEQNILMVSMERTGNSWVAAHISIAHEEMYGILPKWYHESSRVRCERPTTTRPDIPKGWVSVYDVDMTKILKRDYDKIILLRKDYDSLCKDLWLYNHPDKTEDDEFMVRLRANVKRYWDRMFSVEFDDPRVFKTSIEDLNNFTYFEFNRLLDFLEFPRAGRNHVMAVNPSRNWQVYSDVLPIGYPLCSRLHTIQEKFDLEWTEHRIQEKLFFAKTREVKELDMKYPFAHETNPYRNLPEELNIEQRAFRITSDGDIKDILEEMDKK